MEYRTLGNAKLTVPIIGLGCNNFGRRIDYQRTERVINEAIEEGMILFDTANVYGGGLSEEYIGKALNGKRHQVLLATKVGENLGDGPNQRGASSKHILEQIELSLRRLRTDYVDLYQIHLPDPETPAEETMRALDSLVRQGKVRHVGCSNYSARQITEAIEVTNSLNLEPFISVQPEYNMMNRNVENDIAPAAAKLGLGILPYYPLASGFLTGKYKRGVAAPDGTRLAVNQTTASSTLTDHNFNLLEKLESFSKERNCTMVELAITWLLANSIVSSVIAGATTPEQIKANAKAANCQLTAEEKAQLDSILQEHQAE
jgi:aryl-alcohol dehydrogenase-like predicted oxidoreductase